MNDKKSVYLLQLPKASLKKKSVLLVQNISNQFNASANYKKIVHSKRYQPNYKTYKKQQIETEPQLQFYPLKQTRNISNQLFKQALKKYKKRKLQSPLIQKDTIIYTSSIQSRPNYFLAQQKLHNQSLQIENNKKESNFMKLTNIQALSNLKHVQMFDSQSTNNKDQPKNLKQIIQISKYQNGIIRQHLKRHQKRDIFRSGIQGKQTGIYNVYQYKSDQKRRKTNMTYLRSIQLKNQNKSISKRRIFSQIDQYKIQNQKRIHFNSQVNQYSLSLLPLQIQNKRCLFPLQAPIINSKNFNRTNKQTQKYSYDLNWKMSLCPWKINNQDFLF